MTRPLFCICPSFILGLALAVSLTYATPVRAGLITLDSVSSAIGTTADLTYPHTVGAGASRIMVVGTEAEGDTGTGIVTGVTYGGVALTLVPNTQVSVTPGGFEQNTALFFLLNPPTGTADVVVTTAGDPTGQSAISISLDGVAQQPAEASTAQVLGTDPGAISTDITTLTDGAIVIDIVGSGSGTAVLAPDGSQVEHEELFPESANSALSTLDVPTAGLVSMGWTNTGRLTRLTHSVAVFAPIPEPSTLLLAVLGLLGLLGFGRRRRK